MPVEVDASPHPTPGFAMVYQICITPFPVGERITVT